MTPTSTKSWIAISLVLAVLSAAALMPLSATAAAPQEVTFSIGGPGCFGTLTDVVEPVVRTTTGACGLATGSMFDLCCQGSVSFDWTVNIVQKRGAVSGTWGISGNINDVLWQGELHGHVGPEGAEGVISGKSNTGLTLHGTWSTGVFVDPTDLNAGSGFTATAVVST